jgi:hypothetical protein
MVDRDNGVSSLSLDGSPLCQNNIIPWHVVWNYEYLNIA